MSQNAASENGGWAVFLDVDGTILEIAETPQEVHVPLPLKLLLNELCLRLDGALALVSGRSIDDLDRLLTPFRFCAAGIHGMQRREASGCVVDGRTDEQLLDPARQQISRLVRQFPQLLLEDKGCALAVHFRRAPQLQELVHTAVADIAATLQPRFILQPGPCVLEVLPGACTKGAAVHEFMQQVPFCGRTPVFIGDDFTDENVFAYVNRRGGTSIRVGEPIATFATYWLPHVAAATAWLAGIPPFVTTGLRLVAQRDVAVTLRSARPE